MADAGSESKEVLQALPEQKVSRERSSFPQYLMAVAVVVGVTLPGFLIQRFVGHRAIALIYLLAVVVMALFVGRGPTFLAATLSALFWDFFFLAPIANFYISNVEDAILFGMYFVVALVLGQLTARIRAQERVEREREQRATAMYLLSREIVEATALDDLVEKVVRHLQRTFEARIGIFLPDKNQTLGFRTHPGSTYDVTGPEQPAIASIFEQGQPAAKPAHGVAQAQTLFTPLASGDRILAVMAVNFNLPQPNLQKLELLQAFAQPIALALDRQRLRDEMHDSKLLAESERLSKTLLNSMSHEIRTPLAAIKAAASALAEPEEPGLSASQQSLLSEIQEATERLDTLVGKVLDISRLESGRVKPNPKLCDLNDLILVGVRDTRKLLSRHRVEMDLAPGLPLVRIDYVLLQEALKNLLSNAAFHTPPGTPVVIKAGLRDQTLVLTVADRGPGIPAGSLPRIFDKFYRGPGAPTGGTGLGLSVVKGFVEALGGQVTAENRTGGGALFTVRIPIDQIVAPCTTLP